jgi:predicted CoA-binding protein
MEDLIKYVLENYRRIATVGFSKDPSKPAHKVPMFLLSKNYIIYPVNPTANEIAGLKSYKSILDVPAQIDVVQVFRPSNEVPKIIDEVIERKKKIGDVKVVWLQEGIRSDEAARKAEEHGIKVIQDRCMYKEYMKKIMKEQTPKEL